MYAFSIDFDLIACGVAPFEEKLIILCLHKSVLVPTVGDNTSRKDVCRIKIVEPLNADIFTDISDDILNPKEFLRNVTTSKSVSMVYLCGENFYFILCERDLIMAKAREEDDHINWLISRNKFKEAMARVQYNIQRKHYQRHTLESVGNLFITHLFKVQTAEAIEEAAQLCLKVCANNQQLWEQQVIRFKKFGALRVIAKYLPTGPDLVLQPALYELVLHEFLKKDPCGYLNLVQTWPDAIYSTSTLMKATINQLNFQTNDKYLTEALGELYVREHLYQKALFTFLQVGKSNKVFELIWKHQLLYLLEDRIVQLLQLDSEETSRLLILHQDSIPADKVVSRLKDHPRLLCSYLDRLIRRDPASSVTYHNLMFELYTTFEPNKLIPFLRQSTHVQLDKALSICKSKRLTNVVVFILGRMGNTHEALRLIINQMNNIEAAIEFCKEHGDSDLWAELMDISVCKPQLLSTLLREVSTYATDPIGLISRIPEGVEVPDLMPLLVKILHDYRLQVTLEDGCRKVLHSDCYNLVKRNHRMRSRGLVVTESSICQGCHVTIFGSFGKFKCFKV